MRETEHLHHQHGQQPQRPCPPQPGQTVPGLQPHRQRQLQQQHGSHAQQRRQQHRAAAAHHSDQHRTASHRQHAPHHGAQLQRGQFAHVGRRQDQAGQPGRQRHNQHHHPAQHRQSKQHACACDGRQPCRTPRAHRMRREDGGSDAQRHRRQLHPAHQLVDRTVGGRGRVAIAVDPAQQHDFGNGQAEHLQRRRYADVQHRTDQRSIKADGLQQLMPRGQRVPHALPPPHQPGQGQQRGERRRDCRTGRAQLRQAGPAQDQQRRAQQADHRGQQQRMQRRFGIAHRTAHRSGQPQQEERRCRQQQNTGIDDGFAEDRRWRAQCRQQLWRETAAHRHHKH